MYVRNNTPHSWDYKFVIEMGILIFLWGSYNRR